MNPNKRDYTHFSCPHQSYARIKHIFISIASILAIAKSYIRDTVWSDHFIVILTLKTCSNHSNLLHWRLNKSILIYLVRALEIEKAIKEHFLLNKVDRVSAETLWAAYKATIRGKLIRISSQLKKE